MNCPVCKEEFEYKRSLAIHWLKTACGEVNMKHALHREAELQRRDFTFGKIRPTGDLNAAAGHIQDAIVAITICNNPAIATACLTGALDEIAAVQEGGE